jgi:hypothetical protein
MVSRLGGRYAPADTSRSAADVRQRQRTTPRATSHMQPLSAASRRFAGGFSSVRPRQFSPSGTNGAAPTTRVETCDESRKRVSARNGGATCFSPIAGPPRLLSIDEQQPPSALMASLLRTIFQARRPRGSSCSLPPGEPAARLPSRETPNVVQSSSPSGVGRGGRSWAKGAVSLVAPRPSRPLSTQKPASVRAVHWTSRPSERRAGGP